MSEIGHFSYITLPANVKGFPENTNSSYTVKLGREISLKAGEWEIGLADIHYPTSWENISSQKIFVRKKESIPSEISIRSGRYPSINDLMKEITSSLVKHGHSVLDMYFDTIKNQIFLNIKETEISIKFSKDLSSILALEDRWYETGIHRGKTSVDIDNGFSSLYVYCNIAQPRLVGDELASLLRVVPIKSNSHFENVHQEFNNIHYIPVSHFSSDMVEVNIRRDNGQEVPFVKGKVIVNIHLRRAI